MKKPRILSASGQLADFLKELGVRVVRAARNAD
jgi:hypothetical protein